MQHRPPNFNMCSVPVTTYGVNLECLQELGPTVFMCACVCYHMCRGDHDGKLSI